MADGEEWDDLFAKASGQNVKKQVVKPKKKNKKKSSRKQQRRAWEQLLEARIHVPGPDASWPHMGKLGESVMQGSKCSGWKKEKEDKCSKCGKSPLFHRLRLDDSAARIESNLVWPAQLFFMIRNLRCVSVLVATNEVAIHEIVGFARKESNRMKHCMPEVLTDLSFGEGQVFGPKCQAVLNAVDALAEHDETSFEEAVRFIMACDDAYYRLYYIIISGRWARCHENAAFYFAHPAEYFHIPFLAWEGTDGCTADWDEFVKFIVSRYNESSRKYNHEKLQNEIAARYGFDPFRVDQQLEYTDALSFLHHNRALETVRLFYKSGWMLTKEASEQTKEAMDKPVDNQGLSRHETPAPPILAEWRDSCRDRLCNLYAYATVSDKAVQRIKDNLKDVGMTGGIVEVGAGTGYLSALLERAGIDVVAWDLFPPNDTGRNNGDMNEYHGHTPEFFPVSKGDTSEVRRQLPSLKADTALLLCYPPPESPMAKDALTAYLDNGGRCLVHIGEFGGLTGSPEFEELLVGSFCCVDRSPCLSWGTDAAEVTFWVRDDEKTRRKQCLLLPCSNCGKVEASKRCRLVRHVAYWGQACAEEHAPMLSTYLAINMIPLTAETLQYDNDRHFSPIWQGKRIVGGKAMADESLQSARAKKAKRT